MVRFTAYHRDLKKQASSLLLTLSDIVSADRCIAQTLTVESSLCPTHRYEEPPTQCYKCQQYGHTQHQCKESSPTLYNRTDTDDGIIPLDQHLLSQSSLPQNHSFVILGDLNKHHALWSGPLHPERTAGSDTALLLDVMTTYGLHQCVKAGTPTYFSPVHHTTSTIDLVLISEMSLGPFSEEMRGPPWTEIVRILLDKGADVNAGGGEYGTSLYCAAEGGHTEIVRIPP
ncbi:hypothetical protein B0H14DRAFT_3451084 [Mycena olivaceomarginata]|nr:hypothetical protein B0H14DRAFT_3451084 [Mycena olivaceomarginata]